MKRPRGAKKRPKDKPDPHKAVSLAKLVDDCSANFNVNEKHRRNQRESNKLLAQGNDLLKQARKQKGEDQIETNMEALTKLRNALKKDNYSANATYRLAVAYAQLARKGCAILLLKRLLALKSFPPADDRTVPREAELAIKNAVNDQAFKRFRNDANSAMGE